MTDDRAGRFIAEMEYEFCLSWWISLRLNDCSELVYRHGVINCSCGRNQSEAFAAWRVQNPGDGFDHDLVHKARD